MRLPLDYGDNLTRIERLPLPPVQVKVVRAPENFKVELNRDVEYFNNLSRAALLSYKNEQQYAYRHELFGRFTETGKKVLGALRETEARYDVPAVQYLDDGAWIEITLQMPKLKTRKILTKVKPGISTFVEAALAYE